MKSDIMDPDDGGKFMADIWSKALPDSNLLAGIAEDDCAVWEDDGRFRVVSQDFINIRPALLELNVGDAYDLGRLGVKATVSDLAATGAVSQYLLCGCKIPHNYSKRDFKKLAEGIFDEASVYGIKLIGGDTKQGLDFSLIITGFGYVSDRAELMKMSNSKPGDEIWVSGPIGSFAAAVYTYRDINKNFKWKEWADKVIRGKEVPFAQSRNIAGKRLWCGATDITDGFSRDLRNLCRAAGTGAEIELDQIPIEEEVKEIAHWKNKAPWQFAMASGGDFQFMVSARPEHAAVLQEAQFRKVGKMTSFSALKFTCHGKEVLIDSNLGHTDIRNQAFSDEIAYCLSK